MAPEDRLMFSPDLLSLLFRIRAPRVPRLRLKAARRPWWSDELTGSEAGSHHSQRTGV